MHLTCRTPAGRDGEHAPSRIFAISSGAEPTRRYRLPASFQQVCAIFCGLFPLRFQYVAYVVRVSNAGDNRAPARLRVEARDKSGSVVGHDSPTVPDVPAAESFDYYGELGAGEGENGESFKQAWEEIPATRKARTAK